MPRETERFVEAQREDRIDPLHDRRKAFVRCWPNEQMEVITHNTEVIQAKRILCLGFMQHLEEQLFHHAIVEYHLASIDSSAHMIISPRHNHSILAHTIMTPIKAQALEARAHVPALTSVPKGSRDTFPAGYPHTINISTAN